MTFKLTRTILREDGKPRKSSKLKEFNGKATKKGASRPEKSSDGSVAKPLFASKVVTARTPGQGIGVLAEIKGLDELHLRKAMRGMVMPAIGPIG